MKKMMFVFFISSIFTISCSWRATLNNPNLVYKANIDFEIPASENTHGSIEVVDGIVKYDGSSIQCEINSIAALEEKMFDNIKAAWKNKSFLVSALDYDKSALSIVKDISYPSKAVATITLQSKSLHYFMIASKTYDTFDIVFDLTSVSSFAD